MAGLFREETLYTAGVLLLLSCSILCQLLIGVSYGRLIRETDNMATTNNRLLKQCKCKFINCYQLHEGVPNISVFADKFLNRIQLGKFTMASVKQISGQLVLLAVFLCGLGACRSIIAGKTLGQLLPWYVLGIGGVYLYFAVSGLVDMQGKQNILKTNLIDYLENHLLESLRVLEEDKKRIEPAPAAGPGETKAVSAVCKLTSLDAEEPEKRPAQPECVRSPAAAGNSADWEAQAAELEDILQELFA